MFIKRITKTTQTCSELERQYKVPPNSAEMLKSEMHYTMLLNIGRCVTSCETFHVGLLLLNISYSAANVHHHNHNCHVHHLKTFYAFNLSVCTISTIIIICISIVFRDLGRYKLPTQFCKLPTHDQPFVVGATVT